MLTARLRNFEADRNDLDELVELFAWAKSLAAAYESNTIPLPEWLQDNTVSVANEIKSRVRDYQAKALKEIEAEQATLKTREEKRAELAEKAAKLREALGK